MTRLLEILLGLERGFLSRSGEFSLHFNPPWPLSAALWNVLLIGLAVALVLWVYRREARTRTARLLLGGLRLTLLGLLIGLLNRPVLTLEQSRVEPSVLAVLLDDSVSMRVPDVDGRPRLEAAVNLLQRDDAHLLRELARRHDVRLYRFDTEARPITPAKLAGLKPEGGGTHVLAAVRAVLDDLQGERLAGVVLLSDGRQTTSASLADALAAVRSFGVRVYSVPVGLDRPPRNIEIQTLNVQDSAFVGDVVNVKATVRAAGFDADHPVNVRLKDARTGQLLSTDRGQSVRTIRLADDKPALVELQFKPAETGTLDLVVEAEPQPGELDDADNARTAQVSVLAARIAVLYVDGYPRWDYRYLKNEMMRDRTVDISCLLTSADPAFAQEGDRPIRHFPENLTQLLEYDVVVLGDVDPRQFTDQQLEMIGQFVAEKGGGFAMVAGPRWSPYAYRNTPIEAVLPVTIGRSGSEGPADATIGFRPMLTAQGIDSSIFRFFADRAENERYLAGGIPPLFWYCRGVAAKPGVGEVYAEHPTESGPDGRRAPLLVLGRFGAGRTLFSAIDDSWRWRYYTGESVFDTYWIQQLRYLARGRKLGQRRLSFTAGRSAYEVGQTAQVNLRILDPLLLPQLSDSVRVEIIGPDGQIVGRQSLQRQEGQADLYSGAWPADRVGRLTLRLASLAAGVEPVEIPLEVIAPRLELADATVDRTLLTRLASETSGATVELAEANRLAELIPSAARRVPVQSSRPLWDAPLALALFAGLLIGEWIVRKMYGMV